MCWLTGSSVIQFFVNHSSFLENSCYDFSSPNLHSFAHSLRCSLGVLSSYPRFKNQVILDAGDFILKNNSLTFDSMFFLQLKGTAMGTVFAPTYANLPMAYHEIQLYFIIINTYSLVVSKLFEENWFRFLDDCEILLNTKLIKLNDLLTILNQLDPNLQFTMERNTTNLPYLDIMINKTGTKIWMDIYNKPADSKRYVPFTSNHLCYC